MVELFTLHLVLYFFFKQRIGLDDLKLFRRWYIYVPPRLKGLSPPPPPLKKKSVFVRNFEIEIIAWEDSPSLDLSETTRVLVRYLSFFQKF